MYLDLFDELKLNKRLVKLAGFEVAAYWAELQSILKQVVKKQTADEQGFFPLDRDFVERETTLTINKQLKCDEKLLGLGVMMKDPEDPNRIAISVSNMVEVITNEDTSKLKKGTKSTKAEERAAKISGIKITMKRFILTQDPDLRFAYEQWVDGMIDAANCKFTKAVVQLFEKTVSQYTSDKKTQLKIIEIATINSYRDATWAINKLSNPSNFKTNVAVKLPEQKICTGVSDGVIF
jgi:adenine-specific DNA glycosylase